MFKKTVHFRTFAKCAYIILTSNFERNFEELKEIEILKYAEDWDELQRLFVYSENRGQNL